MGSVALGVWLLTASLGAYLFTIWLRHGGPRQREAGITRLPVSLILGHVPLAVVGLAAWEVFLFGDVQASARAACGVVLVVASLGLMTLFRRLPSPGRHAHGEPTAERHSPVAAVVAHGICAITTALLVPAVAIRSA